MSRNSEYEYAAREFAKIAEERSGEVLPKGAYLPPMYSGEEARTAAFFFTRLQPRRLRLHLPFSGEELRGLIRHYEKTTSGPGPRADHLNLLKTLALLEARK